MYGFSTPVACIMGLGMLSLPPSPRWLLLKAIQGKGSLQEYKEKAILALRKLRGGSLDEKVSEKQIEDKLISPKSAYSDLESEGNLLEVFQGPSLKAFIIGGGLVLFSRSLGNQVFCTMQAPYFRALVSLQLLMPQNFQLSSVCLSQLLMTGSAVLKVDDLGRRPLLIGGVGGLAFSLLLLSAYYQFLG